MAFSKSIKKGQIPVGCQLCEGGNKIEWKCTDCNLLMCDRCKDRVHLRIAKDHKTVKIKDLEEHEDSWDSFVFNDLKCKDHPDKSCSLYCKTCSKVICLKCIVKVHNGHTFVDEEELDDKKKILHGGKKKCKQNLIKLSSEKEKIMTSEKPYIPKLMQIKQNILNQKKKLYQAVDEYANALVQNVDQHFVTLDHEEEEKLEKEIKNMHVKNEALERIIASKDFMKFFRDFDKLKAALNEDIPQRTKTISCLPTFVPSEFTVDNFGTLEGIGLQADTPPFEFKVKNQWITKLNNIHYMAACPDGTLWLVDSLNSKILHVKLEKDNVKVISSFNIQSFGIAVLSGDIIVSTSETRLKLINERKQKVTDSIFDIAPLISRDVHISKDQNILIGARSPGPIFPVNGRRVVIVMDQAGNHLTEYELDSNNTRLFSLPYAITSTSYDNICVADRLCDEGRGRVLVIGQDGNLINFYTGHQDVDTNDELFYPQSVLATPSDNIVVTDYLKHEIHILSSEGDFISYCNVHDIGLKFPYSIVLSSAGKLYIGCLSDEDETTDGGALRGGAIIFEIKYCGI